VAIIENYQTIRGTIEVPDALQKYMGDIKEITLQK
jgi:seryl-tRNA synthetase